MEIIYVGADENLNNTINLARKNFCKKIVLEGDSYFIKEPIVLNENDNGLEITTLNNKAVKLTGAFCISGVGFATLENNANIKYKYIGKNHNADMLYLNGKVCILARFPNYDDNVLPLGGVCDAETLKNRVKNYANAKTAYLRTLHSNGWGGNDYTVNGLDENTNTGLDLIWVGDNNRGSEYMPTALVIENVFEELDNENEWFYDKEKGILFYYTENDIVENDIFELTVNSEFFIIKSNSYKNPVKDIKINSIDFVKGSRTLFINNKYMPLLRGDWCVAPTAGIFMENTENIKINDCKFTDLGSNAIFLHGYSKNNVIENNEFINIGATAIQLFGKPSAVYEPSFWEHSLYPDLQVHKTIVDNPDLVGPKTEEYPNNILIKNNLIENVGIYEKQSCGVNLSITSDIKIIHNTIHKSARSNINVNDGTFGGHEIAYNDIFDSQRETLDHGPFNSWGRDRFWTVPEYNARGKYGDIIRNYTNDGVNFYDISKIDAYKTTHIHNNRFHHEKNAPHTWGIDLDDGSSNYHIYNNLCLGMGIKLREGFDRKIYNNILIDGGFRLHVHYDDCRDEIFSNIVIKSDPYSFVGIDETRLEKLNYNIHSNAFACFNTDVELPFWYNNNSLCIEENSVLDVNPMFKNSSVNDYTVMNKELLSEINFINFDMYNFGRINEVECPIYDINTSFNIVQKTKQTKYNEAIISNIDNDIISSTATFSNEGIYFVKVPENSKAYEIGFRTRDILRSIDGEKICNIDDFLSITDKAKVVKLKIHRNDVTDIYEFVL